FLLFYSVGDDADLQCFPTRRSSDLLRTGGLRGEAKLRPTMAYSVDITSDSRRLIAGCEDGIVRLWDLQSASLTELSGHQNAVSRSEEHTSELQSPDQPVCRLLLEKK